jgi:N-acetylmuramoyl-L-alanine amidase
MSGLLLLALAALGSQPDRLLISTADGVERIALRVDADRGALVPLARLAVVVGGQVEYEVPWVTWQTGAGTFRFLTGTPVVDDGSRLLLLPATTIERADSVWIPLAFVSEVLADPRRRSWVWSASNASLTAGTPVSPLVASPAGPARDTVTVAPRSADRVHHVTIDPGHGGTDPGILGLYLPRGVNEKHVTLSVSLLLRDELMRRGVKVTMTRTTDTLINLSHRAPRYCRTDCDLFVSVHVNGLPRRAGYTTARGFETYFQAEAKTADAKRVAAMENDAVRYEVPDEDEQLEGLAFIIKDLQANEFMRESGRAAELVQGALRRVHGGPDRGVKQAGFAVLNTARRPAILIELGFSTNREDARQLSTAVGQRQLAGAIADAIMTYLEEFDRKTGVTETGTQ